MMGEDELAQYPGLPSVIDDVEMTPVSYIRDKRRGKGSQEVRHVERTRKHSIQPEKKRRS